MNSGTAHFQTVFKICSSKNSIGTDDVGVMTGATERDFTGTTSTSASERSLCRTFTASSESSGCTAFTIGGATGCGARNGFNFSAQLVARTGLGIGTVAIFWVFAAIIAAIFDSGATAGSTAFGVNGFFSELNFGR